MQLPIASNYNILIADKRGKMVVVECTPNIKKIGEAKSVDDGYLVCTVNSFISDKLKPYDFAKGDDYHSYTRYSVVMLHIWCVTLLKRMLTSGKIRKYCALRQWGLLVVMVRAARQEC